MKFSNSIFNKILFSFLLIILILFVMMCGLLYSFLSDYVVSEREESMRTAGEKISEMITGALQGNAGVLNDILFHRSIGLINSVSINGNIYVADNNGVILMRNTTLSQGEIYNRIPEEITAKVNAGETVNSVKRDWGYFGSNIMVGVPVRYENEVIAGIYLVTEMPRTSRLRNDVLRMNLFSMTAAFFVAFLILLVLSKRITEPINAVTKAARRLSDGMLNARVKVYKDDEIGQLALAFNTMATSISKQEEMRRSFISDVSHELRTPMTTITGFVQGILDGTIPEEKEKMYLNIVLDESKRLSKLIGDLMDISRLSSEESELEISAFDINELIRLSVIGFENAFNKKRLIVNAHFENETEMVMAEKDSIKRVVTNLLDNAIKFCYENGAIDILTNKKKDKLIISIKNTGEGISPKDQKTVFERFYKLDKSRSQDKIGVGLGLYIVKSIIKKHDESIWIDSIPGEYACFSFSLKCAKATERFSTK